LANYDFALDIWLNQRLGRLLLRDEVQWNLRRGCSLRTTASNCRLRTSLMPGSSNGLLSKPSVLRLIPVQFHYPDGIPLDIGLHVGFAWLV
jgi:hypothetical protein